MARPILRIHFCHDLHVHVDRRKGRSQAPALNLTQHGGLAGAPAAVEHQGDIVRARGQTAAHIVEDILAAKEQRAVFHQGADDVRVAVQRRRGDRA